MLPAPDMRSDPVIDPRAVTSTSERLASIPGFFVSMPQLAVIDGRPYLFAS